MAGLFVDAEEVLVAKWQLNFDGTGTNLTMKLYSNNYTPVRTSTAANFTEATFTGYAAKTLTGATWVITGNAPTSSVYPIQTFTSSADQAIQYIYGFYLLRGASLVYAERFTDGPYAIVSNGDYITVTPTLYHKEAGE